MKTTLASALAISLVAAQAHAGMLVCGGIGTDGRRALASELRGANLAVEFIVAGRGAYVSDVDVVVTPAGKPQEAIALKAEGPVCLAQLSPGRYRIDASYDGVQRTATVTVPAEARRAVRLAMAFPAGADESDLHIKATPEEKQQARTP